MKFKWVRNGTHYFIYKIEGEKKEVLCLKDIDKTLISLATYLKAWYTGTRIDYTTITNSKGEIYFHTLMQTCAFIAALQVYYKIDTGEVNVETSEKVNETIS